jgi:DNA-directed RNA polymerase specialized sigma24 family protein
VAEKPDPRDQEIRRLLAGTEEEIREDLAWISEFYTGPICGRIRRNFRWFPADDLAEAWQDTLLLVFEKAVAGELDTAQPIEPFLWIVLKRRCCDILNKDARNKRRLQALWEMLPGEARSDETQTGEWAELFHLVDKAIVDLPLVQRMVWVAYRELGFSATNKELLKRLRETTKPRKPWTETSVRRGKEEGRKKLRRILKKRGYVWSVPTNPSSRWA